MSSRMRKGFGWMKEEAEYIDLLTAEGRLVMPPGETRKRYCDRWNDRWLVGIDEPTPIATIRNGSGTYLLSLIGNPLSYTWTPGTALHTWIVTREA